MAYTKTLLEQEIAEMQQKLLVSQMNPHFIFNSLNSIKAFINKSDNENASQYLTSFANLTRKILNASRNNSISLDQEQDLLKTYLSLEQKRFNHRFSFDVRIDSRLAAHTEIPPMIVQPIVENAVIHGMSEKSSGGKIMVDFIPGKDLSTVEVEVSDNGKGMPINMGSSSHSLAQKIIAERLNNFNINREEKVNFRFAPTTVGTKVILQIPSE